MTVPRLVRHENPEGRPTPLLLLASLRELDATIELVYMGESLWRLGAVRPTDIRRDAGYRILQQQEGLGVNANPRSIMLGRLLVQGFASIALYRDFGDPAGEVLDLDLDERCTILANFQRRHFNVQNQAEAVMAAAIGESAGASRKEAAQARFLDQIHNDTRAHYRREVHGHTTFGPGGQTGGRGRMILTPDAPEPSTDPLAAGPTLLTGQDAADYLADLMVEMERSL